MERAIHGARQEYNDIASWNWSAVPTALGAPEALVLAARTAEQLSTALTTAQAHSDRLVFVEVLTGMDDVPRLLADIADGVRSRNSGQV